MNKEERIKELNNKILFSSRKNFGMFGNIQWSVVDIVDKIVIVHVSSSTTGWGETLSDGRTLPTKEQIMNNIKSSIRAAEPRIHLRVEWKDWKKGDGIGGLVDTSGKSVEDITQEIADKLFGDQTIIMEPKQCHLWQQKESLAYNDIINTSTFSEVKTYSKSDHLTRKLLKCSKCEQLYFYEFYETVDWVEGNDPQYIAYMPVESEGDAERLSAMTTMNLLKYRPCIQLDFAKDSHNPSVKWVM